MEVDVTGRFERIVQRCMTVEEARARATAMNLSQDVIDYICDEFETVDDDDMGEECAGDNGRIAYGQSWETPYEELAEAMGIDLGDVNPASESGVATYARLDEVFDAFFEE